MKVITQIEIKEINRLYAEKGTYAAVARIMGIAPSTVKKYVIKDYKIIDESTFIRFDRPLPEFNPEIFRIKDWSPLCELSTEETDEIRDLWKELEI